MDNEKLVQVAMNVIMHAGDARDILGKQEPNYRLWIWTEWRSF